MDRPRALISAAANRTRRATSQAWVAGARLLVALTCAAELAAAPMRRAFDIPSGEAAQTLRQFAQQAGEQMLYPVDQVRGVRTRAVRGEHATLKALELMLANTGLIAVQDWSSGAIVIKRRPPPVRAQRVENRPVARWWSRLLEPPPADASDAIVALSPFEVRSGADAGYRAANVISATRVAVALEHLPMSITSFTEEFIEDQHAYDLYDIVRWAAGVHQDNVSPQGWVRYSIRGFTSAAVQRNGFASFRFIDTTNLARVEVVKGPASLLYGQINPGGVINYITKRPEAKPAVRVSASVGDRGYARGVIDATGPLDGDSPQFFYRAIVMTEDLHQFHEFSDGRKEMLAPSLTWKLSDHATLTLDYEHFRRRDHLPTSGVVLVYVDDVGTVPYPGLSWDFSYAGEGDYQDFVSDVLTVELTAKPNERFNLRAAYSHSTWDMEWRATGQGGTGLLQQSVIDAFYPPEAALTPMHAMYRRNRWEHQWGGERTAQLDVLSHFQLGGFEFDVLLGAKRNFDSSSHRTQKNNPNVASSPLYLRPWDLRDPSTWDRRVPFGVEDLIVTANQRTSSQGSALFGVVSGTGFDGRLRLLGGYARHWLRNDPARNLVDGTTTPSSERSADVPQAGVMLQVAPGLAGYVSYSESFLANGTMLRVDNVLTRAAEPSVGRGYEVGLKLDLFDGKLSGTFSAYRIDASPTGIIVVTTGVDPDGTTRFTDVQGGSQVSEGFECEWLLHPAPELQIMASFSRSDAIYERHPINPKFDGSPLVATPERAASVWAKYQARAGRWRGLVLAGGLSYVGRASYVGNNPALRHPSYLTGDVTVGYRFEAIGRMWDADLTIKNFTDKRYFPSASSWGFPRHVILSLGTEF